MPIRTLTSDGRFLSDVDALARATHGWVRQQLMEQRFLGVVMTECEEQLLAAGFLAGLRALHELEDAESLLVAYAYLLMRGHRDNAAGEACALSEEAASFGYAAAGFRHGRNAARRLCSEEMPPPGLHPEQLTN